MQPEELGFWQFSADKVIPRLLEGFSITLEIAVLAAIGNTVLGLLIAFCHMARNPISRWVAISYTTLFRGTPLLLQIMFIYYALPMLLDIRLDALPSGILALGLNAAAYLAEIFRAAIQSIHKGQMEAARALGMSYVQAMRLVILPQAFVQAIPPFVNELAALTKDTSLVSVIALADLLFVTQRISAKFLRPWEVYFWSALCYLIAVVALSSLAAYLERRLGAGRSLSRA